jgi:hypothetical protein
MEDWMAYIGENTEIRLHNVYTGVTVDVEPLSSVGFGRTDSDRRIMQYDSTEATLKKVVICSAPTRYNGYNDQNLIIVFDVAVTSKDYGHGWSMLAPTQLCPAKYEDAMRVVGNVYALIDEGSCFVWHTHAYGKRSNYEHSTCLL